MSGLPQTIGRYRVVAALGEGAMGEVVRARDERLGRDVAIKRVKNSGGEGAAEFAARFEAEARALAALAHPGVVQIFDFERGQGGEEPYLVMELVEGQSLRAVIKERAPLPEAEVRAMGIQLARALEAAHARGILHRDVKPANVLRATAAGSSGGSGGWKLADFGVAQLPDSEMTSTGQFIGTPAYAAPEALALAQFSPASDVYGLAATLVEASSGKKPRKDATLAELMAKSHEGATLEGVPDELAAILRPALALDARARPSAGELAELLAGSPETGQILLTMAARAKSGPAFVGAGEQETRVGGAKRKNAESGESAAAVMSGAAPGAVETVGVPDEESRAAATAALRAGGASSGGDAERSLHTVAVPDETRARAMSEPGRMRTPMPSAMPAPNAMPSPNAMPIAMPMPSPTTTPVQMPHPIPMPPSLARQAEHATATATEAVTMPSPAAPGRRISLKQMIGVGAGLIVVLAVISRACSEQHPASTLRFPASATTPGIEPGPEPLSPELQPGIDEPLRFDMPPDLDPKSARDWAEVARSVNEGKFHKALDKLEKVEERAGESPESAKLRAWLEEHADEEGPGPPHPRKGPRPHERDD